MYATLILLLCGAAFAFTAFDDNGSGGDTSGDSGDDGTGLNGTSGDDTLMADGDGGLLHGWGGDDEITGGAGADTLEGNLGDDSLTAAGDGTDPATSPGDQLDGGMGNDTLTGVSLHDTLNGGGGRDVLIDGDALWQQAGETATTSHSVLNGGGDRDTLIGSDLGGTTMTGGDGADVFLPGIGHGGQPLTRITDFDPRNDVLDLPDLNGDGSASYAMRLSDDGLNLIISDGTGDLVQLDNVQALGLGNFAAGFAAMAGKTVTGTDGNDRILGSGGPDSIDAGAGDDSVFSGSGDDTISGGAGDDYLDGGSDYANYGHYTEPFPSGDDLLDGGAGNDTLVGHQGADTLLGGAGNDTLVDRYLLGRSMGDDSYYFDDPAVMDGGSGDDYLGGGLEDTITGGAGDDLFQVDYVDEQHGPAVITDFTPGEDQLQVEYGYGGFEDQTYQMTLSDDGKALLIGNPDAPLVRLEGITSLTPADFPQGAFS